jgi:hypothetical protein
VSVRAALEWLTAILSTAEIRFQVVGGLAARIHGSQRPLADIDVYVPEADLGTVEALGRAYVVKPLQHFKDSHWDLKFLQFEYRGQQIEVGGAGSAKLYDAETGTWIPAAIVFEDSEQHNVDGIMIPVMPLDQLIAYKRCLGREVDRADLAFLVKPRSAS